MGGMWLSAHLYYGRKFGMGAVGIFKPARPAGTGESETGENWGESHWRLQRRSWKWKQSILEASRANVKCLLRVMSGILNTFPEGFAGRSIRICLNFGMIGILRVLPDLDFII
jgi:hypothetical protein